MTLTIEVPGASGCDFAAFASGASNRDPAFLPERAVYEAVRAQTGFTGFEPGFYDVSVRSSCSSWDILLTPR
jgi:hypothetical protein